MFRQIFPLRSELRKDKIATCLRLPPAFFFLSPPTFWEARDQPEPGSFFPWMKDPGNEVDVAKSFASKQSLLRRMQFLPRKQMENVYTKVISPSVSNGPVVWGSCYKTHFSNLEILNTRAGRIVYGVLCCRSFNVNMMGLS